MSEITRLEEERQDDNEIERDPQRDNSGSGATEDREKRFEYKEEREIDNEYVTGNEYIETGENKEVHMIKMNIKLPNPTMFD
eukprot:4358857-Amphidinium_carterae.1